MIFMEIAKFAVKKTLQEKNNNSKTTSATVKSSPVLIGSEG